MLSTLRRTLFALLACASFIVHAAAPDEITTAWPVNVGPLNPHLYTPNQMFAQSMVYEPLVKYQADGSVIRGWQKAGLILKMVKPGPSPCVMT